MPVTTYTAPEPIHEIARIIATSFGLHSWHIHLRMVDKPMDNGDAAMAIYTEYEYLNATIEIARDLDFTTHTDPDIEGFIQYMLHEFCHILYHPFVERVTSLCGDSKADEVLIDDTKKLEEQHIQQFTRSAVKVWAPYIMGILEAQNEEEVEKPKRRRSSTRKGKSE